MPEEIVVDPNVTPVTEPVVEPTPPTEPSTGDASAPEGSFYSGNVPKELEGPYKEMQAAFTRNQQALARERMSLRSMPATASPTSSQDPNADPYAGQISSMEAQVREVRLELMNTQIDRFAETHKDVYDHAAEMADMMLKVPNLSMETAYWAIKGPKAEQAGRMKAMSTLQTKIEAPSTGPVGKTNVPVPVKAPNTIAEAVSQAYNQVASQQANR